jgi:predicted esterase
VTKYKRKFFSENIETLPVECPLTLYTIEPTEKHTASLIYLHGLGDSGKGWSQIMEKSYAKKLPFVKFIFPNANKMPITLNNGYNMPAWFDLHGLNRTMNIND